MTLPFISPHPKVGDPPQLGWEDFQKPQLRRFPGSSHDFQWQEYLGGGEDGFVFKASIDGRGSVALKIVSFLPPLSSAASLG